MNACNNKNELEQQREYMKKLLLYALLLTSTTPGARVTGSDGQTVEIADELTEFSTTLQDGTNISLENATSKTLKLLVHSMEELQTSQEREPDKCNEYKWYVISSLNFYNITSFDQLINVFKAAYALKVNLVTNSIAYKLAEQMEESFTRRSFAAREKFHSFPFELQELVAKHFRILYRTQLPLTKLRPEISANDICDFYRRKQTFGTVKFRLTMKREFYKSERSKYKLNGPNGELQYFESDLGDEILDLNEFGCTNLSGIERISHLEYYRLRVLKANDCNLKLVPNEIGTLSQVKILDFSDNKLTTLPSSIRELRGLKRLYLKGNPLPPEEIERVRRLLPYAEIITD